MDQDLRKVLNPLTMKNLSPRRDSGRLPLATMVDRVGTNEFELLVLNDLLGSLFFNKEEDLIVCHYLSHKGQLFMNH